MLQPGREMRIGMTDIGLADAHCQAAGALGGVNTRFGIFKYGGFPRADRQGFRHPTKEIRRRLGIGDRVARRR